MDVIARGFVVKLIKIALRVVSSRALADNRRQKSRIHLTYPSIAIAILDD